MCHFGSYSFLPGIYRLEYLHKYCTRAKLGDSSIPTKHLAEIPISEFSFPKLFQIKHICKKISFPLFSILHSQAISFQYEPATGGHSLREEIDFFSHETRAQSTSEVVIVNSSVKYSN